jgi:hypothetical protein
MRIYVALAMINLVAILILAFENISASVSVLLFFSHTGSMMVYTFVTAFLGIMLGFLLTKVFEDKQKEDLDLSIDED